MEGLLSDGYGERACPVAMGLAHMLEMVRQLEAEMGLQGGGAAWAQRCRAIVSGMRSTIDRSILMARTCCMEGRLPGRPESPPSGDGSPRSAGSDQAGDSRFRGNAAGQCKKRKTLPKWSTQVRVSSVQDVGPLDDGFSWRKYGQKDILGAKYPRAYFRCTHRHSQSCHASKQVQRADGDPLLFDVVYQGNHTCAHSGGHGQKPRPAAASSAHQQPQAQPAQGLKDEGSAQGQGQGLELEPFPPQFLFPSKAAPAAGTDTSGAVAIGGFPGCATAAPGAFVSQSQAMAEHHHQVSGGSGYAPGGGGSCLAGVQSVPDVLLTSTTNSPMGDMDFMLQLDADFLDNPAGYFV